MVLGFGLGSEVTVDDGAGSALGPVGEPGAAGLVGVAGRVGTSLSWLAAVGLGAPRGAAVGLDAARGAGVGLAAVGLMMGAESQPPPTEVDATMPGRAAGGDTRGLGAVESVRLSENDQPCTVPGGGEIFPAPKVL